MNTYRLPEELLVDFTHVEGKKNSHDIKMYALSTCEWCKITKEFFKENDVDYNFIYVDELEGEEKSKALETIRKWNPMMFFPVIVVDNDHSINGYEEGQLKELIS